MTSSPRPRPPKLSRAPNQIRAALLLLDVMTWRFAPDSVVVDGEIVEPDDPVLRRGHMHQRADRDPRVTHSDPV